MLVHIRCIEMLCKLCKYLQLLAVFNTMNKRRKLKFKTSGLALSWETEKLFKLTRRVVQLANNISHSFQNQVFFPIICFRPKQRMFQRNPLSDTHFKTLFSSPLLFLHAKTALSKRSLSLFRALFSGLAHNPHPHFLHRNKILSLNILC